MKASWFFQTVISAESGLVTVTEGTFGLGLDAGVASNSNETEQTKTQTSGPPEPQHQANDGSGEEALLL